MNLPAPSAGILTEQRVELGATVKVGASIGTNEPASKPAATESGSRTTESKPDPKTVDAKPAEAKPAEPTAKPAEAKAEAKAAAPTPPAAPQQSTPATPTAGHAADGASQTVKPALTPNNRKILRERQSDPEVGWHRATIFVASRPCVQSLTCFPVAHRA